MSLNGDLNCNGGCYFLFFTQAIVAFKDFADALV